MKPKSFLPMFPEEPYAHWEFNLAPYFYKKFGPHSDKAKKQVLVAHKANSFVIEYITGKLKIPKQTPSAYSAGSKDEANCCVEDSLIACLNTEAAIEWLSSFKLGKPKKSKQPI